MPTDLKKYRAAKRQKIAKKKQLVQVASIHGQTTQRNNLTSAKGGLISIRECKICGKNKRLAPRQTSPQMALVPSYRSRRRCLPSHSIRQELWPDIVGDNARRKRTID